MSANETITAVVNHERARRGLSQAGLAALLGRGDMWVSHKLHGRRRWQIEDLDLLSQRLGVPLPALLMTPVRAAGSAARTVTSKYRTRGWRARGPLRRAPAGPLSALVVGERRATGGGSLGGAIPAGRAA